MRPIGAAVHLRAGTVNRKLVVLMASASVRRDPRVVSAEPMGNSKSDVKH